MTAPTDRDTTQRTQISPGPDAPAPHSACVVVIHGEGLGKRADISTDPLVVGRSHEADLYIPHPSVSRQHCAVWHEHGRYRIRDLGSTNRTRVNERVIDVSDLADGDHVTVGESILKFISHASVEARYHEEVHQLASHDSLTDFSNRRHFLELLEKEIARAEHQRRALSLAILDVDHFKRINDRHGHPGGDVVLRQIAALVRSQLRADELVGRIGGEEFAIVYPDADPAAVRIRCEALRETVARSSVSVGDSAMQMTVSIGIAHLGPACPDRSSLMRAADAALYRAKETGRNRICVAGDGD
ncbi:GGDEF domain-containing protein [Chiayiivirga flava]|uniref:diguanylate cyclase n=1 Tax=Chiayiivirga flava TaxID=659595 RepID=A0A7W8D658_9GAMM|nr:GGDEF domain-containing protein [Chiayiivirga flava]MBB5206988.1 diguanylate cyclase (GGDEF)-like protein [Chiayiivirga flava]